VLQRLVVIQQPVSPS